MRDARNGTGTIETTTTRNFAFLAVHDPALADVAALAERYFADDPVTSLMKVRQLGELLAQQVAARAGVLGDAEEPQLNCSAGCGGRPPSRATSSTFSTTCAASATRRSTSTAATTARRWRR